MTNRRGINLGFDGLLIDYEYWNSYYGDSGGTQTIEKYSHAIPGFTAWQTLAGNYIDKRNKSVNGTSNYYKINAVDCYLSRIVFYVARANNKIQ
ncbi:MAG: hypothetical protein IPP29_18460 [Bacteroidetes bacterium]|nr:hypothetical protein [Bacteroidota bacterium]